MWLQKCLKENPKKILQYVEYKLHSVTTNAKRMRIERGTLNFHPNEVPGHWWNDQINHISILGMCGSWASTGFITHFCLQRRDTKVSKLLFLVYTGWLSIRFYPWINKYLWHWLPNFIAQYPYAFHKTAGNRIYYQKPGTAMCYRYLHSAMDDLLIQALAVNHWLEVESDKETCNKLWAVATALVIGSNEDHAWAVVNWCPHWWYLGQATLLLNPHVRTPWTHLYTSCNNRTFITTMSVNTVTFCTILVAGFGNLWYTLPIHCPDTHTTGHPRRQGRSLDAEGGLGLHWLSSTMQQLSLQQIFTLIPSTVSRYLWFTLSILLKVLRKMPSAAITWPHGDEFLELSSYVSMRHWLLDGVFGSIDGLNLPCQVPNSNEMENATYNGWLHGHFISSVIVFSAKGLCPIYGCSDQLSHSQQER